MEVIQQSHSNGRQNFSISSEVEQIVENAKFCLDKFNCGVPDVRSFSLTSSQFVDLKSSESVLIKAKRLGILSNSTYDTILPRQNHEREYFKLKTEGMFDHDLKDGGKSVDMTSNTVIYPGQVGYFMSRFLITWNPSRKMPYELSFSNDTNYDKELEVGRQQYCNSCVVDHENIAEIRSMVDSDWLYLGKLSKSQNMENSPEQPLSSRATEQEAGKIKSWSEFVKLSAKRALQSLKFIPVSAR